MSAPSRLESIRSDLSAAGIPSIEMDQIAASLGLESADLIDKLAPSPADPARDSIAQIVERSLGQLPSLGGEALESMAQVRIFFETVMAWKIAADRLARSTTANELRIVQEKMWQTCRGGSSSSAYEECWRLDGEFHRALCRHSGLRHLELIVDAVLDACLRVGVPRSGRDIEDTLAEHAEIIAALTREGPDRNAIFVAIRDHVMRAKERWFPKEGLVTFDLDEAVQRTIDELRARLGRQEPDLDKAVRLAIEDACAANGGSIPESSRDLIREDFAIQIEFPEEFVVYIDRTGRDENGPRVERVVTHHSKDLDEAYRSLVALEAGDRERATLEFQPNPRA